MTLTVSTMAYIVSDEKWTTTTVNLVYDTAHPFEMTFQFVGHQAPWKVGRDLVQTGLTRPVGRGDVRLWPSRVESDALYLQLTAPSGTCLMEFSRRTVAAFLERTATLMPYGQENLDNMDAELEQLLGGGVAE